MNTCELHSLKQQSRLSPYYVLSMALRQSGREMRFGPSLQGGHYAVGKVGHDGGI